MKSAFKKIDIKLFKNFRIYLLIVDKNQTIEWDFDDDYLNSTRYNFTIWGFWTLWRKPVNFNVAHFINQHPFSKHSFKPQNETHAIETHCKTLIISFGKQTNNQ